MLCGGKGTRALPVTASVPKPLIPVGDRPLLRHVLDVFACQGATDFVLAAGYRADLVREFAATLPSSWVVDVHDTGEDTGTAGRINQLRPHLGSRFFCTYGDGLANVDLAALVAFHEGHGGVATVTTVPLRSQYGTVDLEGDRVARFVEKPVLEHHRINGGYFVFDEAVFDAGWHGDDLEHEVLPRLAAGGDLYGYRHDGFWRSADTYKETQELSQLCADGAPWLRQGSSAGTES